MSQPSRIVWRVFALWAILVGQVMSIAAEDDAPAKDAQAKNPNNENEDALRVTFRDQEVWSVARLTSGTNLSKEPYAFFSPQQIPLGSGVNEKKVVPAPKLKP